MKAHANLWLTVTKYIDENKEGGLEGMTTLTKSIQEDVVKLVASGLLRLPQGLADSVAQNFVAKVADTEVVCSNLRNYLADVLHTNIQKGFLKSPEFEVRGWWG